MNPKNEYTKDSIPEDIISRFKSNIRNMVIYETLREYKIQNNIGLIFQGLCIFLIISYPKSKKNMVSKGKVLYIFI
jgi:hypothetical protein